MVLNELENRNRTSKFWQILHLSRIIENVFISLKILSSLYSIFIILISNDNYIQNTELLNETTLIYLQQTNTIEILFNLIRIFNFLNAKYIKYDLKSSYFCKQKTYMLSSIQKCTTRRTQEVSSNSIRALMARLRIFFSN